MNFAIPLLAAFAGSLALTPAIRLFARSRGLIARPSQDRWHQKPTALLGGAAVFGGFLVGMAAGLLSSGEGIRAAGAILDVPIYGILIASSLMFFVGLLDDRIRMKPATKLIFQGVAAAIVVSSGVIYPVSPWAVVNVLVTLFWFLAVTNALNLLDNMDGVAVGVAAVAALFLSVTFVLEGATALGAICLALAGGALGFLPYNFHRASIFMGDSGSLFLGAMLASLAAAYPGTAPVSVVSVLFVPAAIVIIPILDTLLVTVTRTLAGRPISVGGRDHTTHRLVAMGLSERQVALLLYAFAATGGSLGLFLRAAPDRIGLAVGGLFLVGLLVFAAYLGRMHTYTQSELPRRRVTLLISDLLHKRRAFEVVLDLILFAIAYQAAYLFRWDGRLPPEVLLQFESTVALAVVCKSVAFGLFGLYRGSWHQINIRDAHRIVQATLLGSLATTAVLLAFAEGSLSPSVLILDGLLVAILTSSARASFRSLDVLRHALQPNRTPVLIYGAGKAGELVVRELIANTELGMKPIGFLDDNPTKRGWLIQGYPVLGAADSVAQLIEKRGIRRVILGSKKLLEDRVERLCDTCSEMGVEVLQVEVQFVPVLGSMSTLDLGHLDEHIATGEPRVALGSVPLRSA